MKIKPKVKKYGDGGKSVNTLEGDLYSKVLMNRNKNLDFVQRANAVGQYPESNMFQQFDPNEFGQKNSHLMGWGEDDNGQAYMAPSIFNDKNEAIKVPNQYADYISSIGYKHATGIPTKQNGGSVGKWSIVEDLPKAVNGYKWSDDKPTTKPIMQPQNNLNISQTAGNRKLTPKEVEANRASMEAYNKNRVQEEYNNRKNRIQESIDAQKQPLSLKNLQTQTQSTGDKFSLAMNSKYGNPKDYPTLSGYMQGLDYINPAKMIGDMASGLGSAPQDVNEGNYLKAGLSVGTPLFAGATAGIGTQGIKPFVNNLVNPLAGTGEVINNLGNKYLPNAYKLNPKAFKPNPEAYYRTLGKEGIDDAFNSGVIRPKQTSNVYSPELGKRVDLNVPAFPEGSYFNKSGLYSNNKIYNPDYIAEVVGKDNLFTYPERIVFNENIRVAPNNIPIEEANFYKKDWLKGYKPIEIPKSNFKSEIDWSKWNKEIPENTQLMKEYNAIEQTSKANGTWMKNPDGSKFQGTPEQFVQQNSENFKKAFGNSKLVNPDGSPWILEHGSPKKFDTFDESKFQLGDAGYSGSGIYTVPPKGSADSYTISGRRFHTGDIEPTTYKLYGQGNNPITSEELIKLGTNSPAGKEMDLFNFHRKSAPLNEQLLDYDVAIHNQNRGIARVRDLDDAWEVVFPTNKQLKSAIGNNGMFDMTNPNIYKALVPGVIGLGAASQIDKKQNGGNITTESDKPIKYGYGGSISYKDFKKKYNV